MTRLIQANEPSPVVQGDEWIHPVTAVWKMRWGTSWVEIGNVGSATLGLLDRRGGNMSGAITGAHGLVPSDNPDFTTSARVEGAELSSKNWVTESLSSQYDSLYALIPKQAQGAGADMASRIAFGSSVTDSGGTLHITNTGTTEGTAVIPLPYYGDSGHTQATISEVVMCVVSIANIAEDSGGSNNISTITCFVDPLTLVVKCKNQESVWGTNLGPVEVHYAIICMRA